MDNRDDLIKYVSKKLFNVDFDCSEITTTEWQTFFNEAVAQQVECAIYDEVLNKVNADSDMKNVMSYWRQFTMIRTLSHKQMCKNVSRIFIALNEANIPYVTFKGYVFKELYPNPEMRYMGDIDIYVEKQDISIATKLLNDIGYIIEEDPHHPFHLTFKKDGEIDIELHFNFFHDDVFHNNLYLEKHIWENTRTISIDGVTVCVPSLEHTLVHGILHIATHFVGKGFGLRQLVDIGLFLDKYESQLSFETLKLILEDYKSVKTYVYLTEMCNRYFRRNFDVFNMEIEESVIDALDDLLFDSGVFGQKSYSNELKLLITKQKLQRNIKSNNSLRLKMIVLFPSSKRIGSKYSYAKKIKLLLPVAWIHRMIAALIHPNEASKELLSNKIDVHSIEQKVHLMEFLDLNINE